MSNFKEEDANCKRIELEVAPDVFTEIRIEQNFEADVGFVVWDAALVLIKYFERLHLANPGFLSGRTVLELGAGTGVCSLACGVFGADRVRATDLPELTEILRRNVARNSTVIEANKVEVLPLAWGEKADEELLHKKGQAFDVVLLVDCVYYEASLGPLLSTLDQVCEPGKTEVFCCFEQREIGKPKEIQGQFLALLRERFSVTEIPLSEQHEEFCSADILLLKFMKLK